MGWILGLSNRALACCTATTITMGVNAVFHIEHTISSFPSCEPVSHLKEASQHRFDGLFGARASLRHHKAISTGWMQQYIPHLLHYFNKRRAKESRPSYLVQRLEDVLAEKYMRTCLEWTLTQHLHRLNSWRKATEKGFWLFAALHIDQNIRRHELYVLSSPLLFLYVTSWVSFLSYWETKHRSLMV